MALSEQLTKRYGAHPATDPRSGQDDQAPPVPLARLYWLRLGYLIMAVGLALTKWPLLISHSDPWPLMEGVVTCMLVALSLLAFLGLRHPLAMLPVLLFELAWKAIWVAVVALPLWAGDRLDPATTEVLTTFLVVLIVLAVVPWRYVFAQYVTKRGDPWRRIASGRTAGGRS
jgi:hypothetical protein